MLKKNNSEKRFHTAGARIPFSRKLPSDFFMPTVNWENKEVSLLTPFPKMETDSLSNHRRNISSHKNPQ